MKNLLQRIKKNWKSLICAILGLILLTIGNSWCTIIGAILSIAAMIFNLYSGDIEWEEFNWWFLKMTDLCGRPILYRSAQICPFLMLEWHIRPILLFFNRLCFIGLCKPTRNPYGYPAKKDSGKCFRGLRQWFICPIFAPANSTKGA